MKALALLLGAALAASATASHAWFFIFPIPGTGGMINNKTPLANEICVPDGARAGDRMQGPSGPIMLETIVGPVNLCHGSSGGPVLAKFVNVVPAPTPVAIPAPTLAPLPVNVACVAFGTAQGDRTKVAGREVEIVRIVRNGPPCDSRPEAPLIAEYREIPAAPPTQPVNMSVPAGKTVPERLRELKQLREENLITQDEYDAKRQELLKAF